ncbi:alpha/beta hydrolase family protein [Staphylospora marina]|uniref:alpha/beta hydrolase family protein n=1 Tax=Staphylospora marina TaxID=2490858 RepID=UPI0013DE41E6|nr:alpha/beta fold hydrolase [Staphylospora marina]
MNTASFLIDLGKEHRVIRGNVTLPAGDGPHPVVILCHGFKGFKDWGFFPPLADKLAREGYAAIRFNFSMNGMGENPESFDELDKFARNTFSREQEDLAVLLRELRHGRLPFSGRLDADRVSLLGHSRGGGNSLIFALDHPEIRSVVVWNSIHRADFFDPSFIAEIREKGTAHVTNARTGQNMPVSREVLDDINANRERFDILGRLPKLACPLLVVQGDADAPRLREGAPKLAAAAPRGRLHVIPETGHTFGAVHPFAGMTPELEQAMKVTVDFLKESLN